VTTKIGASAHARVAGIQIVDLGYEVTGPWLPRSFSTSCDKPCRRYLCGSSGMIDLLSEPFREYPLLRRDRAPRGLDSLKRNRR
jgi:hypothetical protein